MPPIQSNPVAKVFGQHLGTWIRGSGQTQAEFGASLGIPYPTLQSFLHSRRHVLPDPARLREFASSLKQPLSTVAGVHMADTALNHPVFSGLRRLNLGGALEIAAHLVELAPFREMVRSDFMAQIIGRLARVRSIGGLEKLAGRIEVSGGTASTYNTNRNLPAFDVVPAIARVARTHLKMPG